MRIQLINKTTTYQYLTILGLLLVLSFFVKKGDEVLWINGLNTPFLDIFFTFFTNLGDGLIFVPLIIALLFIRFQYAVIGVVIVIFSSVTSILFKQFLFPDLSRPKNVIDNNLLHFIEGVKVHGTHSFPSGHTMTAFCAALLITLILRNRIIGILTLLIALLVAYSRIYLLQHFLTDVTAGAIIGSLVTLITWQLFEQKVKSTWMERRLTFNLKSRQKQRQLNEAS